MSTSGNLYSSVQPYSVRNGRSKKRSDLTIVLELNKHCSRNFELQERHTFLKKCFFFILKDFQGHEKELQVQFKILLNYSQKPTYIPSCLSEVTPTLPLKEFACLPA